jgi:hypothetical protein
MLIRRAFGLFLMIALLAGCAAPASAPAGEALATEPPPPAEAPPGVSLTTDWFNGVFSYAYPWPSLCCTRLTDMIFKPLVTVEYNYQSAEIIERRDLSLASDWSSDDFMTWRFKLRSDVAWHDGEPFTAADVEFTYNLLLGLSTGWQAERLARAKIEKVVAVDAQTVDVVLSAPNSDLPRQLSAIYILPRHLLEGLDQENAEPFWPFFESPVGLGAFIFAEYGPDEAVLKPNAGYFLGAPSVEPLIVRRVDDIGKKVMLADSGELDVIHVSENETGWQALQPLRENASVRVAGYWAVNNRVKGIEPLGGIGDLPSYHQEELWAITDSPPETPPQEPKASPAERIQENVPPLEPLLAQNGLSLKDFNFAATASFPPDTPEFTQAVAPVYSLSPAGLDGQIVAIFYINRCVNDAGGCSATGQDMAIKIWMKDETQGFAQYLVWDDAEQREIVVEETPIQISGEVRGDDTRSTAWFVIGNSHSIKVEVGGIIITIPVPWHDG